MCWWQASMVPFAIHVAAMPAKCLFKARDHHFQPSHVLIRSRPDPCSSACRPAIPKSMTSSGDICCLFLTQAHIAFLPERKLGNTFQPSLR